MRERITDDGSPEPPPLPAERGPLLAAYDEASATLQETLRETDPATEV